jgi:hypothetical protein
MNRKETDPTIARRNRAIRAAETGGLFEERWFNMTRVDETKMKQVT